MATIIRGYREIVAGAQEHKWKLGATEYQTIYLRVRGLKSDCSCSLVYKCHKCEKESIIAMKILGTFRATLLAHTKDDWIFYGVIAKTDKVGHEPECLKNVTDNPIYDFQMMEEVQLVYGIYQYTNPTNTGYWIAPYHGSYQALNDQLRNISSLPVPLTPARKLKQSLGNQIDIDNLHALIDLICDPYQIFPESVIKKIRLWDGRHLIGTPMHLDEIADVKEIGDTFKKQRLAIKALVERLLREGTPFVVELVDKDKRRISIFQWSITD